MLKGGRIPVPMSKMLGVSFNATRNILVDPTMKKMLADPNTKFDVVITVYFIGHEAGYYMARRFGAQLAIYMTAQVSFPTIDDAFGQPHHPALQPFPLLPYLPNQMGIFEKTLNFMLTHASTLLRKIFIVRELEAILDEHFPKEDRPPLLELEKNASLALQFGHPLILDGLRAIAPNYIYVGMMNCRPAEPLPKDLRNFLDEAKEGVVYISFGWGNSTSFINCNMWYTNFNHFQFRCPGLHNA